MPRTPRCGEGSTAGQALRGLPGGHARPAPDHLLHERVRDLPVGRSGLRAASRGRLPQEGRAGVTAPSPSSLRAAGRGAGEERHRRAVLPEAGHREHRRAVLTGAAQGAAGDGDRQRQDSRGCRAGRLAAAGGLGEAGAVSGRPGVAGEPGGGGVQGPPAGVEPGEPGDGKGQGGPGLRLHLSDDDGADQRDDGHRGPLRGRAFRSRDHRRGAPFGVSEIRGHLSVLRLAAGGPDRDASGSGRPEHLRALRS